MGRCDQICSTGTEEQCNACILSQYAGGCETQREAVDLAERKGLITVTEHNLLCRYIEDGEILLRLFLGLGAEQEHGHLAGTDAPKGGAA